MATLAQKMQLAQDLFGREPQPGEVRTYATALGASSGGTVRVELGGEAIDVPTVGEVAAGDEVIVQVQNGHPVAIGARGAGDRMASRVSSVERSIVDMGPVLSYVWLDDYGQLRITPEPKAEAPDTGVMINAEGVNVVGYTYSTHTGEDGFSVVMGGNGVLQVLADAQSPDFQHNIIRSTDVLYIDADPGTSTAQNRTRLMLASPDTAGTYYAGDVARLEIGGDVVWAAGKSADGYYLAGARGDCEVSAARGAFNNHVGTFYGTCATAAATQAKAVECDRFTDVDLVPGTRLLVHFATAQTYNGSPTLTVNGIGPNNVVRMGTTAAVRYMWQAGEAVEFMWNGTDWLVVDGALATTTYYGVTKLNNTVTSTSASVAATANAVKTAYDKAVAAGTWRAVTVATGLPSGFDDNAVRAYANDGARLLWVSIYAENTSGAAVSVPANTNLLTCTDTTLYPANMAGAPIARIGSGFRYNASALLDFPVRLFQWSTSAKSWGLRGPAWAFSASSIHYDALIPYDALGIA